MAPRAPDARQLSDLLDLSQTLGATLNLRQALQRVLAILEESRGTLSGTIVLRDEPPSSDLVVEAASGAGGSVRSAGYRLGEGIVGCVAQSGRTVVVPEVSQEPLFLDRSGVFRRSGRSEMSTCACRSAPSTAPWARSEGRDDRIRELLTDINRRMLLTERRSDV